jgi:hypothetical protein
MGVVLKSRALSSWASLATIASVPGVSSARVGRMVAFGLSSLTTSVSPSGASIETMGAAGLTELTNSPRRAPTSLNRFQEKTTSRASTALPFTGGVLENRAFLVTFAVSVRLSGDISHDSRMSPSMVPSVFFIWPSAIRTRRLNTCSASVTLLPKMCGSNWTSSTGV